MYLLLYEEGSLAQAITLTDIMKEEIQNGMLIVVKCENGQFYTQDQDDETVWNVVKS